MIKEKLMNCMRITVTFVKKIKSSSEMYLSSDFSEKFSVMKRLTSSLIKQRSLKEKAAELAIVIVAAGNDRKGRWL